MIVFTACIDTELLEHCCTECVLGEHALDCLVNSKFRFFFHKLLVLDFLESSNITCVIAIIFVFKLLACEDNVFAVDDDDVIAAIHMGREGRLVLAAKQHGSLSSHTTEGLTGGINDIPFSLDFVCLRFLLNSTI